MSDNAAPGPRPRVVGLGALCDLRASLDLGRTKHFSVSEFADLEDGERVVLHNDRGMTVGHRGSFAEQFDGSGASPELLEGVANLESSVLTVVLPDEDDGEEHPWEWLVRLARAQGLEVTVEELRAVPYRVEFTPAVLAVTGTNDF